MEHARCPRSPSWIGREPRTRNHIGCFCRWPSKRSSPSNGMAFASPRGKEISLTRPMRTICQALGIERANGAADPDEYQVHPRRCEELSGHLERDLFQQPEIRSHDFRRQRLSRPGQIPERFDRAVWAGSDRKFIVPYRQHQIRADGHQPGHRRQRSDRSRDRQYQPGPGNRNPELGTAEFA